MRLLLIEQGESAIPNNNNSNSKDLHKLNKLEVGLFLV